MPWWLTTLRRVHPGHQPFHFACYFCGPQVFLNGGPAYQLNPTFSLFVRCDSQEEIDSYWGKLIEGGKPMACGWLTDRFGLCWQIVPRNIGELISHPKAMEAMMGMIKMDLPALEAAAREN